MLAIKYNLEYKETMLYGIIKKRLDKDIRLCL
jgi:hypothetical protein